MRKNYIIFICCAFLVIFIEYYSYAETIYTKDGETIKVRIVATTENTIWYEVQGGRVGISKSRVTKILNDNGAVSQYSPVASRKPKVVTSQSTRKHSSQLKPGISKAQLIDIIGKPIQSESLGDYAGLRYDPKQVSAWIPNPYKDYQGLVNFVFYKGKLVGWDEKANKKAQEAVKASLSNVGFNAEKLPNCLMFVGNIDSTNKEAERPNFSILDKGAISISIEAEKVKWEKGKYIFYNARINSPSDDISFQKDEFTIDWPIQFQELQENAFTKKNIDSNSINRIKNQITQ